MTYPWVFIFSSFAITHAQFLTEQDHCEKDGLSVHDSQHPCGCCAQVPKRSQQSMCLPLYCLVITSIENYTYEEHCAPPTPLAQNGAPVHDELYLFACYAQAPPFFQRARQNRSSEWFRALPARRIPIDSINCDSTILSDKPNNAKYRVLFHLHLHGFNTRCKGRCDCGSYSIK